MLRATFQPVAPMEVGPARRASGRVGDIAPRVRAARNRRATRPGGLGVQHSVLREPGEKGCAGRWGKRGAPWVTRACTFCSFVRLGWCGARRIWCVVGIARRRSRWASGVSGVGPYRVAVWALAAVVLPWYLPRFAHTARAAGEACVEKRAGDSTLAGAGSRVEESLADRCRSSDAVQAGVLCMRAHTRAGTCCSCRDALEGGETAGRGRISPCRRALWGLGGCARRRSSKMAGLSMATAERVRGYVGWPVSCALGCALAAAAVEGTGCALRVHRSRRGRR